MGQTFEEALDEVERQRDYLAALVRKYQDALQLIAAGEHGGAAGRAPHDYARVVLEDAESRTAWELWGSRDG